MAKYLFSLPFLVLCLHLVNTQDDVRCPATVMQLVEGGCSRECITATRDFCPVCMRDCDAVPDECTPGEMPSQCTDAQFCLAAGVGGRYICVDRISEGMPCVNLNDERLTEVIGVVVPCLPGLVCRRETIDSSVCRREINGPCTMAVARGVPARCDDEGNFEPLQCVMTDTGMYQCRCVEPTGTLVPGTEQTVSSRREATDCEDLVLDRCFYRSRSGLTFNVRSGESFIELATCRRCLCRDGDPVLCAAASDDTCNTIDPPPIDRDCVIRGRTLPNGQSVAVDCNRCKCNNGALFCTRIACEEEEEEEDDEDDPEEERNCRACFAMRASPVCGDDGRTYPSRCFAMNCRGLAEDQIIPGPCSRRNLCEAFPCNVSEVCLRAGGVTCLSREGCRVDRLRRCVDITALRCRTRDDDDDDDDESPTDDEDPTNDEDPSDNEDPTDGEDDDDDDDDDDDEETVCGRDGMTYASVCNLLQNSPQTEVAYAGECGRTECTGGEVCGTDGETYDNICDLRLNSANARVDYRGACIAGETDEVVNDRCDRVRRSGRCAAIAADCSSRIRPGDGCCPVCGGGVTIGLDRDAVDEYVRLNPSVDTVDEFLERLIVSGFIPRDILRRCRIVANLLRTGDLNIVLENRISADRFCAMFAQRIADRINNPPEDDGTEMTIANTNPQILQLATVAETSPLVGEDATDSPTDGAVSVASFSVAVMLMPILALFM